MLRRPPRPPLPPSAHDVLREARLLRALARHARARAAGAGGVRRRGGDRLPVLRDGAGRRRGDRLRASPTPLDTPDRAPAHRRAADRRARGDPRASTGRRPGWRASASRPATSSASCGASPGCGRSTRRARSRRSSASARGWPRTCPSSGTATIVHGDYRLGNTIFAAGAPGAPGGGARLGDGDDRRPARRPRLPVHDVDRGAAIPKAGCARTLGGVTRREGFPTRAELIGAYEQRSGRSMRDLRWYTTLALWKSVVFMEGNYKRAIAGSTDDPYLKQFGDGVLELARQAETVAYGELTRDGAEHARPTRTAAAHRPADRLGRGADERTCSPPSTPSACASSIDPQALRGRFGSDPSLPRAADRAREGRARGGRVRAAARVAARRRARRPDRRPVRGRAAGRGDGRGRAPGPRGGRPHGARLELLGRAPLSARHVRGTVRRRRDLRRGAACASRRGACTSSAPSAPGSRPRTACTSTTSPSTSHRREELGMATVHHTSAEESIPELERLLGVVLTASGPSGRAAQPRSPRAVEELEHAREQLRVAASCTGTCAVRA